jgi:hypothetical protein
MVVTLMFRPPGCGNDEAAFDFNSKRILDCAASPSVCTAVPNFMRAKTDRSVPPMELGQADGKVFHLSSFRDVSFAGGSRRTARTRNPEV